MRRLLICPVASKLRWGCCAPKLETQKLLGCLGAFFPRGSLVPCGLEPCPHPAGWQAWPGTSLRHRALCSEAASLVLLVLEARSSPSSFRWVGKSLILPGQLPILGFYLLQVNPCFSLRPQEPGCS